MKIQLILLDTPIIVSDEKFEKKDLICFVDLENNFVVEVCKNIDNYNIDTKKIIAGLPELPSIDFNGFEEQLGVIDVEKLALKEVPDIIIKGIDIDLSNTRKRFIEGFKAAQKLNEKKFSLADIEKAIELARVISDGKDKFELDCITGLTEVCTHNWCTKSVEEIVQKLSQPKVFDIEVETEKEFNGEPKGEMEFFERPKVENNKIKIIKVV